MIGTASQSLGLVWSSYILIYIIVYTVYVMIPSCYTKRSATIILEPTLRDLQTLCSFSHRQGGEGAREGRVLGNPA